MLLDIGGGTTDIAVYSLGGAIYTATIPVGGNILTNDISLGLEDDARRKPKTSRSSYGAGDRATTASRRFSVRDARRPQHATSHSTQQLRQIVVPRVLETLRMAKQKIVENVPRDLVLGEVVMTGGGAQLPGIEPIAEEVFGLPVRVGVPSAIGGLTDSMSSPQYATAIGLVLFGANGEPRRRLRRASPAAPDRSATRSSDWLADLWNC